MKRFALLVVLLGLGVAGGVARTIHLPAEAPIAGTVLIAESFTEKIGREIVPREFPAWPGSHGIRPATWFNVTIEAHPGDVIVLAPGAYEAEIWIFTPHVTVRTDPDADELAWIHGTVEVDADHVVLERLGVTNAADPTTSGHGIEINRQFVNYVTLRECHLEGNRWTGIHMIGATGTIQELRIENCRMIGNGMDGMDSTSTVQLIVTGCTITNNGRDLATGVGIRIGSNVQHVELTDNVIENNRFANVQQKE